jgi:hypothetical protein
LALHLGEPFPLAFARGWPRLHEEEEIGGEQSC